MDNIDKKIREIVSQELKPHKSYKDTITSTIQSLENKRYSKKNKFKLILATACCSILLITGGVFAKDIGNLMRGMFSDFGLGEGVATAVDNGYIGISSEDTNMQKVEILENDLIVDTINVETNINKFIITDDKISLDMDLKFESKINNYVDIVKNEAGEISYENSYGISLSDLIITDEENRVIYSNLSDKTVFDDLCQNYNLDCSFFEYNSYNENYLVGEYDDTPNFSRVNFIYTLISSNVFPSSQKLNIYFTKITLFNDYLKNEKLHEITLLGDWKFCVDVPDIMYNRTSNSYEVTNCNNKDFNVYETKLTDTGFEIGIEISNLEKPVYPEELTKKEIEISETNKANGEDFDYSLSFGSKEDIMNFYGSEEYADLYENYWRKKLIIGDPITLMLPWLWKYHDDYQCYVENQNGEKYRLQENSNENEGFIEGNKYNYHAECELNKYNATDELKVIIVVEGEKYEIQLKK